MNMCTASVHTLEDCTAARAASAPAGSLPCPRGWDAASRLCSASCRQAWQASPAYGDGAAMQLVALGASGSSLKLTALTLPAATCQLPALRAAQAATAATAVNAWQRRACSPRGRQQQTGGSSRGGAALAGGPPLQTAGLGCVCQLDAVRQRPHQLRHHRHPNWRRFVNSGTLSLSRRLCG